MSALSLAFQEFGEADKPPLIILHGFFASSRNWRVIAETLAEDYHVLVPIQKHYGQALKLGGVKHTMNIQKSM